MENDWHKAVDSLSEIAVFSNPNNEPVTISGNTNDLKCVGVGTDAAVFQPLNALSFVFKKYAKDKASKVQAEAKVYQILGDSPFFSTCFASSDEYLVLNYEEGKTLFDCILQGIHIPKQVIREDRKSTRLNSSHVSISSAVFCLKKKST